MLFLTHLMVGVLVGLLVRSFLSGGNYIVFFFLVLLGSILPDIDEGNSKITKWTGLLGKVISLFSRHRGFFHSLFFVILATLVVRMVGGYYYAWGLFLGLMGHLCSDGLTKAGVNFFCPFSRFEVRGWVKTGSVGETVIQAVVLGLIIMVVLG